MGTNYYAVSPENTCEHCGRYDTQDRQHIGKSSAGWCFSLHVIPELSLNSLEDWQKLLKQRHIVIEDEYGSILSYEELMKKITERRRPDDGQTRWSDVDFRRNGAEPGPGNLARHSLGAHCIGHGDGTWDLITGDFS